MLLAEALSIRKDTQTRIRQLEDRIRNISRIQEGDEPSEDPKVLMDQLATCFKGLGDLILRINETNMATIADGKSLTALLAERDVLRQRVSTLRNIFDAATATQDRYSRSEIKMVTTIDVKKLGKEIDKWSMRLRELDMKIQVLNFSTEMVE